MKIAFLDFESSGLGLGAWPIEVGIAVADADTLELGPARTWLIRPAEDWLDDAWDPIAEDLHGLSRLDLTRDGLSAWTVAEQLTAALVDVRIVYSDAPLSDSRWAAMLFEQSPVDHAVTLREYATLIREEVAGLDRGRANAVIREASAAAACEHTQAHRALPDACRLRTTWLHVARAFRGGADG